MMGMDGGGRFLVLDGSRLKYYVDASLGDLRGTIECNGAELRLVGEVRMRCCSERAGGTHAHNAVRVAGPG